MVGIAYRTKMSILLSSRILRCKFSIRRCVSTDLRTKIWNERESQLNQNQVYQFINDQTIKNATQTFNNNFNHTNYASIFAFCSILAIYQLDEERRQFIYENTLGRIIQILDFLSQIVSSFESSVKDVEKTQIYQNSKSVYDHLVRAINFLRNERDIFLFLDELKSIPKVFEQLKPKVKENETQELDLSQQAINIVTVASTIPPSAVSWSLDDRMNQLTESIGNLVTFITSDMPVFIKNDVFGTALYFGQEVYQGFFMFRDESWRYILSKMEELQSLFDEMRKSVKL